MPDERIPKVLQYKELTTGKRTRGRPHPRLKNVCKRDMWTMYVEVWEDVSKDHSDRRFNFHRGLERGERNDGFPPGRSVLDLNETWQHRARSSLHVFVAMVTITSMWSACISIIDAAPPSETEAYVFERRSKVSQNRWMPHTYMYILSV